jgi:hypothetical protein
MFTKKTLRVLLIAAIALLAVNVSPGSAEKLSLEPLPAPAVDPTDMGYAFTYQGRLLSGTSPANGVYDFEFKLFDDASAGTLIGTDYLDDYTVTGGLFMAPLDFGAGAFTGFERWLEIGVKPDASVSYTKLSPRQQINPAPYATFARTIYRKTVVVKPVGTASQNGTELLNALAGISGASSSNRFLLKIEPGIYNIGGSSVVMQPYVDIEGSGETATRIESTGYGVSTQATVIAANNSELRSLTVVSDAGGVSPYAIAVLSNTASPILIHVSMIATSGTMGTFAFMSINGSSTAIDNATMTVLSATTCMGITLSTGSTLTVSDSSITVNNCEWNIGINNVEGSVLTLLDSRIEVVVKGEETQQVEGITVTSGASTLVRNSQVIVYGNGTNSGFGIWTIEAALTQVFESTIEVMDGAPGYGIYLEDSSGLELTNAKVTASGSPSFNTGIYEEHTQMTIRDSQIIAEGTPFSPATGIQISDEDIFPEHEITRTYIRADTPGDAQFPIYWGVNIWTDGRVKFYRDTIEVEPFVWSAVGGPAGGIGILNDGGTVTFENSTINSADEEALIGIQHIYYTLPGTFNMLYVNNSEIYTCKVEPTLCNTILASLGGGTGFQQPFVYVGSSLLWGGNVNPGLPNISCMWVHDENYNGFGWPVMGPVPANPACP